MVKILSNFDTKFPQLMYQQYVDIYGSRNVLLVRRSFVYMVYRIIIPLLSMMLLLWGMLSLGIWLSQFFGIGIEWIFLVISIIIAAVVFWKVIGASIDFFLDFTIVTPRFVMEYDQLGVFGRTARSLDSKKIKSVRVDKKWFLKSLFNYGDILFYGEWDTQIPEIAIKFIYNPLVLRDKITRLIHK